MSLFGEEEGQIIPPYKGPLSSYAEWHATVTGFQDGISEFKGRNKNDGTELPTKDARKEPHMYDFGYSLGTVARWSFMIVAARYGLPAVCV